MVITLDLPAEIAQTLQRRAAREGRTLEAVLHDLAAQEARTETQAAPPEKADAEEEESCPWRGIFELNYPRSELFRTELTLQVSELPPLPAEIILDLRRITDDEP